MTEIGKFENLKFLSETHRLLHEKRQRYEWKIIFTSLTFYIASVGAVYTQKVNLPTGILISCIIWTIFLSFAVVAADLFQPSWIHGRTFGGTINNA